MGYDSGAALAVDSAGGVVIAANVSGTISFGGTTYP